VPRKGCSGNQPGPALRPVKAPFGPPLVDTARVEVTLTVDAGAEDAEVLSRQGREALRQGRVLRREKTAGCHFMPESGSSAICVKGVSQVGTGNPRTRFLSKSNFARPYIWRLINFKRLTWPSTWPLLHS
jgi:hypothetical protein